MFSGPPAPPRRVQFDIGLLAAIAGVAFYALLVGWAILTGRVAPERAYLLFALPCLVPALWYLYGFLRSDDGSATPFSAAFLNASNLGNRDFGLVLSAAGWFFAALTFLFKHFSSVAAVSSGLLPEGDANSPASWFFAVLSFAALAVGGILSGKHATAQRIAQSAARNSP